MTGELGVGVDDLERRLPGQLDQLAVTAERGELEVAAALLRGAT